MGFPDSSKREKHSSVCWTHKLQLHSFRPSQALTFELNVVCERLIIHSWAQAWWCMWSQPREEGCWHNGSSLDAKLGYTGRSQPSGCEVSPSYSFIDPGPGASAWEILNSCLRGTAFRVDWFWLSRQTELPVTSKDTLVRHLKASVPLPVEGSSMRRFSELEVGLQRQLKIEVKAGKSWNMQRKGFLLPSWLWN